MKPIEKVNYLTYCQKHITELKEEQTLEMLKSFHEKLSKKISELESELAELKLFYNHPEDYFYRILDNNDSSSCYIDNQGKLYNYAEFAGNYTLVDVDFNVFKIENVADEIYLTTVVTANKVSNTLKERK